LCILLGFRRSVLSLFPPLNCKFSHSSIFSFFSRRSSEHLLSIGSAVKSFQPPGVTKIAATAEIRVSPCRRRAIISCLTLRSHFCRLRLSRVPQSALLLFTRGALSLFSAKGFIFTRSVPLLPSFLSPLFSFPCCLFYYRRCLFVDCV